MDIDGAIEEPGFAGVVRVDVGGETVLERAVGLAHRGYGVPLTVDTRLAMASGSKAFTALVALATLPLDLRARELLGADLPLLDDAITVEHLLTHRSGIGDHVPEDGDIDAFVLDRPVHTMVATEDWVPVLDGRPRAVEPGERFEYCNAGYVVLALLAERATGTPFLDLVQSHVLDPAGLDRTAFLRSNDLPGDVALGYLDATGDRTNVLHLPVVGTGDGGAYTTVGDVHRFWAALDDGTLDRGPAWEPRGDPTYGCGFWLDGPWVALEGYDAGVSFRSEHDPASGTTWTVMGAWSDAAWPVARALREAVRAGG